jgi:hypothetical protein
MQRANTTYEWFCDMCGRKVRDSGDLHVLYGFEKTSMYAGGGLVLGSSSTVVMCGHRRAEICHTCARRPISDLVDHFAGVSAKAAT